MTADTLTIVTARCCTDWPVLMGVMWRRCGICGQTPVIVPGSRREVPAPPPTQGRAPKLVAVIDRKETP